MHKADEFLETFVEDAPRVLQHHYTVEEQSKFYSITPENLKVGEVLVVADFFGNYSFVYQDSVQGVLQTILKLWCTHLLAIIGYRKKHPYSH